MSDLTHFIAEAKGRIPLSSLIGRRVKLERRGHEFIGLCPFHQEKTPSFHVVESKEFYHCFGCGAHGDHISFLTETEGLSFRDALERLSSDSGLPIPEQTPQSQAQQEERATAYDVLEAACKWFTSQLYGNQGDEARRYLEERGVPSDMAAYFRIGFAPDGYDDHGLLRELKALKVPNQLLHDLGLMRKRDDGSMYPFFRNRIMFPINDRKGRVVAFGGRYMADSKTDRVGKYINSPEHALFQKGQQLYNLDKSMPAARKGTDIIVAEGYMDVITLMQYGFKAAVAPLGTALTEVQLQSLWRLQQQPVLCFDGDEAGQRAALKAAQRALPELSPGQGLRFIFLPQGYDPDNYLRSFERQRFQELIDQSIPLSQFLFDYTCDRYPAETPEQQSFLEKQLMDLCQTISDGTIKTAFTRDFRDKLWQNRRKTSTSKRFSKFDRSQPQYSEFQAKQGLSRSEEITALKSVNPKHWMVAGKCIMRLLIDFPELFSEFAEILSAFPFTTDLDKLHKHLQIEFVSEQINDSGELRHQLRQAGFAHIIADLYGSHLNGLLPKLSSGNEVEEARAIIQASLANMTLVAHQEETMAIEGHDSFSSENDLEKMLALGRSKSMLAGDRGW